MDRHSTFAATIVGKNLCPRPLVRSLRKSLTGAVSNTADAKTVERSSSDNILDGQDVSGLSKDERADIRCQKIGFVFQGFNLLSRDYVAESR